MAKTSLIVRLDTEQVAAALERQLPDLRAAKRVRALVKRYRRNEAMCQGMADHPATDPDSRTTWTFAAAQWRDRADDLVAALDGAE